MKKSNILMIITMISVSPLSFTASATTNAARTATKYIPTIIASNYKNTNIDQSSLQSAQLSSQYTLTPITSSTTNKDTLAVNKFNNFDAMNAGIRKDTGAKYPLPILAKKPINGSKQDSLEDIVNKVLSGGILLPDNNEYHIETDLLSDKDIESFKQKFNDETDAFIAKLSEFWTLIKDRYDELENHEQSTPKKEIITPTTTQQISLPILSREQVFTAIKRVTEKVFDPSDKRPLSAYITEMKTLTHKLDPVEDKTIIDAVDFLQSNIHRTSIWDIPFWKSAVQEKSLTAIPYSSKIKETPNDVLLNEFIKKVNLKDSE